MVRYGSQNPRTTYQGFSSHCSTCAKYMGKTHVIQRFCTGSIQQLLDSSLDSVQPIAIRHFAASKGTPLWLQLQKGTIFHLEVGNRHPVPVDRSRGIPNSYWKTDYVFSINTNTDNNSNNNNDILIIDICISRMIILPAPHHLTPQLLGVNPCRATNDDGIQPALRCFHPCAKTSWPAPRLNVGRRSQVEIMWT